MTTIAHDSARASTLAALAAGLLIAQQVAAKAARDAIFLDHFPVTVLPTMLVLSALLSGGAVLATTRALSRFGPFRLMPLGCVASAAAMGVIATIARHAPRPAAVLLYFHVAVLGSLLISGFWSLVSELFDPRTARRRIGSIAAGGTLGGLLGGIVAERLSSWLGVLAVLPLLAALHLAVALALARMRPPQDATIPGNVAPAPHLLDGLKTLWRAAYLREVALLALALTVMAAAVDYVFKARAADAFRGVQLLRFFAWFYVATGAGAFVLQASVARRSLERVGLARTVALLPASVGAATLASLAAPGLVGAAIARACESIFRNSMYRSGFELFFTPVPAHEKRATRAVADVGVERAGDALGGALVRATLIATGTLALAALKMLAIALAALCVWLALRLHRRYVEALERNLQLRAVQLGPDDALDRTTRETVVLTLQGWPAVEPAVASPANPQTTGDRMLETIAHLRSGEPEHVQAALARAHPLSAALAAHVIPLLGRDDLAQVVARALQANVQQLCGQLVDRLLDPQEDFTVRRRLPRVLASCATPRAAAGLLEGLRDRRFEVRLQCGRALRRLTAAMPQLHIPPAEIEEAILREAAMGRAVWESQRVLDAEDEPEGDDPLAAQVVKERGGRSQQHVFTLLSLILPRGPLEIAYRGLSSDDPGLRGTSLEYLDGVLPASLRTALWPLLEDGAPPATARRPAEEVLEDLLSSGASMLIDLRALQREARGQADVQAGPGSPAPDLEGQGPGGGLQDPSGPGRSIPPDGR